MSISCSVVTVPYCKTSWFWLEQLVPPPHCPHSGNLYHHRSQYYTLFLVIFSFSLFNFFFVIINSSRTHIHNQNNIIDVICFFFTIFIDFRQSLYSFFTKTEESDASSSSGPLLFFIPLNSHGSIFKLHNYF